MSWQAVARKDFQDASRSYLLWGLTIGFIALVSLAAAVLGWVQPDPTSTDILGVLHMLFQYIVPLIAIAISFGAIVNERDSGSLKILLSLPHSRTDVILGKALGRTAAFVVPLVLGMLVPAVALLVVGVDFEAAKYFGYLLLATLFGVAFVSVATGMSATFESRFRVLLSVFGFYFLFNILWRAINTASFVIVLTLSGQWPSWMPLTVQETLRVFQLLSPTGDFQILRQALMNDVLFASEVGEGLPDFRLQLGAMAMLLVWITLPILIGILRFEDADL
ncbi:ABC transporter permease [Halomicrobium sp. IBSBa]|uniref:ABC transporter permease n=1 Tax=Halomicrobium sp. IBSBa TaxID=2778916 RepID=UPI001ABFEAE0|nr:ABC transporter permease subunit [Halomicrobium sp. IBSBa]MBO4247892.1 ABC transporter permease [Halomicrobium sp. IBSBa]